MSRKKFLIAHAVTPALCCAMLLFCCEQLDAQIIAAVTVAKVNDVDIVPDDEGVVEYSSEDGQSIAVGTRLEISPSAFRVVKLRLKSKLSWTRKSDGVPDSNSKVTGPWTLKPGDDLFKTSFIHSTIDVKGHAFYSFIVEEEIAPGEWMPRNSNPIIFADLDEADDDGGGGAGGAGGAGGGPPF